MVSFEKNLFWVSLTQIVIFLLAFITSIVNARLFGPEGVGVLSILLILQQFSVKISDFGFNRAFRFYANNLTFSFNRLFFIALMTGCFVGVLTIFISILLKFANFNIWNTISVKLYFVFLPTLFFYVIIMYLRSLLHGFLHINAVNLSEILEKSLYILMVLFFYKLFGFGLLSFSLAITFSSFLVFIHLVFYSLKLIMPKVTFFVSFSILRKDIRFLLNYGQWSYYSAFLEYLFLNLPIMLLKSSVSSFVLIGYYSRSRGLADLPNRFGLPLANLLFSYNANSDKIKSIDRTINLCKFSFWIITFIFILMSIFIKKVIILFYGIDFLPASDVFYYMYPSTVFFILSIYLSSSLAANGFNRQTFIIRLRTLPFILIIIYVFVTNYGIYGAAIGSGIAFFISWIQYIFLYLKIFKVNFLRFFI